MGLASKMFGAIRGTPGAHPTPVAYSLDDGCLIGHNGDAWLWRVLPQDALHWEDRPARDEAAQRLSNLLVELGRTSRGSMVPGLKIGGFSREFHMLALWWDKQVEPPEGTSQELREWLHPSLSKFSTYESLLAVGVRLRRSGSASKMSVTQIVQQVIKDASGERPDPMVFAADRSNVSSILKRAGGEIPTEKEQRRLETWWNGARGANAEIVAEPDGRSVSCDAWPEGLEMSVLVDYEDAVMDAERGLWMADAFGHPDGCVAVSIRGEVVPPKQARDMMRSAQRKGLSRLQEQESTGDLAREEDYTLKEMSEMLEQRFVSSGEPLLRNLSVMFARPAYQSDDTFISYLDSKWGLQVKLSEYRQVETLEEMLPCSASRIGKTKPFAHDATVGFVAESGISAFARLGDNEGVWLGLVTPEMSPVWCDPRGSSKSDKPPSMCVVGEPGAGKTFLLQSIATQAALAGETVVMINPKPADSLSGFAAAIGGEVVRISSLEKEDGMLDPFRYAAPEVAADIASSHITSVLTHIDPNDEVNLMRGLHHAASEGARCVGEALQHPYVPEDARNLIFAQAESSALFRLGIGMEPRPQSGLASGLTLIEFDRPLDLPASTSVTYDRTKRISVAAVRLVTRSALERMFNHGGGVMILDEAHVFLSSEEGRAILERLGREGRSQRILPVLATQRIADILAEGVDLGSYIGRSIIMKMTDPKETKAALELVGLVPTEGRAEWLAAAGPRRGDRGAMALHRDLQGRCSAMLIGPIDTKVAELFSTNPLDREQRDTEHKEGVAV